MGKMNIHKINNSTAIRTELQNDIRTPADEAGRAVKGKKAVGEDRVEFSSRASEVTKLVDQVKQLPDVREARISELRAQIADGKFNHSAQDIADAILSDERS